MTPDRWLEAHSYFRPLADLSAQVERAVAAIDVPDARIPDWEDYRADFLAGVPLLSSADAAVDLEPGGRMAASAPRKAGLRTVVGKPRGGGPRARDGTAARAPVLAPHRGLSAGRRDAHAAVPRAVALCGMDGDGTVPPSRGERLRRLARRDAVASPVLPDLRVPARDGPTGWRRPRAQASALVRPLQHALAVQANRLPVL